jgi:hypothetical protein
MLQSILSVKEKVIMKKLNLFITLFFVLFIAAGSANATSVLNAWNMNLSLLNGQSADGVTISGAADATDIDHIHVAGLATVTQTVVGGVALGNPFTESGFLQMETYRKEGASLSTNLPGGNVAVYLDYSNLAGTLNGDGSITFDPTKGSIGLYATNDGILDPTGNDFQIATYNMLSPSGGSGLDFYGGTAANSTVDVTLQLASIFNADFFTDSNGNPLDMALNLHLTNVDSLLDPNFDPNPDNSGVINGDGFSIIHVQNAGQYNVSAVPEPNTLMLLGLGLIGIAGIARKKACKK